jgi:outer membrane lipoprotein-sorting protein
VRHRTLDAVSALPVVERHPSLRWLAPLAVVTVLGAFVAERVHDHSDGPALPPVSARELAAQAQSADRPPFAGTAVANVSAGTAVLAEVFAGTAPSLSLARLASGSHTLRVWYGGPARQRVALVDPLQESDLFRSGDELWQWSSTDRVAIHSRTGDVPVSLWTAPATPADLAVQLLASASADVDVTVAGAETVANRPAYGLVLRPTSADSLFDYVHIAVDGATKTPLAVQIYPRDDDDAAVDVAFTSIAFKAPSADVFTFRPPRGSILREAAGPPLPAQFGEGWTSVQCYRDPPVRLTEPAESARADTVVHGSWGDGRLVQLPLLSALITRDGRAYVGSVTPEALYDAARQSY